jgi:hypothetical protein
MREYYWVQQVVSFACSFISFLAYLERNTEIGTGRKQNLIYNRTLLPSPYIIHVVFSLKSAAPCLYGIRNPPWCSRELANAAANRLARNS